MIEQRETIEATRLKALQEAASQGWSDIAAGRCRDLSDNELDSFIAGLGQEAASRSQSKA